MPTGLKRYQQTGHLHFITFSCYHRLPFLSTPDAKNLVEQLLEHTRQNHGFELRAYVLMPEHVHLLLSEPTHHTLATTLKVLKQETSKLLIGSRTQFWQDRYFDFNVRTEAKRLEKIRYIHRNPVRRGLTTTPEAYPWSSAHHYATGTLRTIHLTSYHTTVLHPPLRRTGATQTTASTAPTKALEADNPRAPAPNQPLRRKGAPFMAVPRHEWAIDRQVDPS